MAYVPINGLDLTIAKQIASYEDAIAEVYSSMSIFSDRYQTRQCDRCKKWQTATFSFLTERSWLCHECRVSDIADSIQSMIADLDPVDAASLREYLEKRAK